MCPFDSAVAIQIDRYRLETRKLNLADSLILNLNLQVSVQDGLIRTLENRLFIKDQIIETQESLIVDKNKTIDLLSNYYFEPKQTWWQKNRDGIFFGSGLVIGVGGVIAIIKSL